MALDQMPGMPAPGPDFEIVRLKASQTRHFIALGNRIVTYRTHWDQKHSQTIPCFTPHEDCDGHRRKLPQRAKGYLHVWRVLTSDAGIKERIEGFLEFTPVSANDLCAAVQRSQELRGVAFSVTRLNGAKAHLRVAVFSDFPVKMGELPEVKSPYESVMRMWGFLDFPPENEMRETFS